LGLTVVFDVFDKFGTVLAFAAGFLDKTVLLGVAICFRFEIAVWYQFVVNVRTIFNPGQLRTDGPRRCGFRSFADAVHRKDRGRGLLPGVTGGHPGGDLPVK
jgi:hypothetical protein